jgi:uncharacterized protein (DUF433 family)
MTFEVCYPHIKKLEGEPARLERHPRIRVAQIVMDYLAYGWSAEEMCRQHPYLTIAEAHAAMLYYWDRQEEIDAEIRAEWEQVERDRSKAAPSPFFLRHRSQGTS